MFVQLGMTKNDFQYAGQVDSNLNHYQMTWSFLPYKKLLLQTQYVYSETIDLNKQLVQGIKERRAHHNVAASMAWRMNRDMEISFDYGVGTFPSAGGTSTLSPMGDGFLALDTQDFIRFHLRGKF